MNYLIIDAATGEHLETVFSLDGIDLNGKEAVERVDGYPDTLTWDSVTRGFAAHPIEPYRERACRAIDSIAGKARERLSSSGFGMTDIYQRKENEARKYLADPAPDLSQYPLLAAHLANSIDGVDDISIASLWINKANEASAGLAAIEVARLSAKNKVSVENDRGVIEDIVSKFKTALNI